MSKLKPAAKWLKKYAIRACIGGAENVE